MTQCSDAEQRLLTRIAQLVNDALSERGAALTKTGVHPESIYRTLGRRATVKRKSLNVLTLARIADALGYEVIIQFRDKTA